VAAGKKTRTEFGVNGPPGFTPFAFPGKNISRLGIKAKAKGIQGLKV
jgi:hypothetical protein